MWPERLLRVAQMARGLVSISEVSEFFQLAQLSETRGLGEVERYDGQYKRVLGGLLEASLSALEAAESLSIPFGRQMRAEVEAARQSVQEAANRVGSARPFHILLKHLPSEVRSLAASNLPSYDFVPLARAATLGKAASTLCVALEAGDTGIGSGRLKLVGSLVSEFLGVWGWRSPENLSSSEPPMASLFRREFGPSPDLDVGFTLSKLRRWRLSDRPRYLRELVKLVHAAVEEVRGAEVEVTIPAFHAMLSGATLFLDIGMNDIMVCLADLRNRGWIEGMEERMGRQLLVLRQPNVERLVALLKDRLGDAAVTTSRAVEALGWDYYTALHVIKQLERSGELGLDENAVDECTWQWRNGPVTAS